MEGREGGSKPPRPNSFSSVTSPNVGFSPQRFLTFSLTLSPHWCKISSSDLVPVQNYQDHSSKNQFYWSNPYKTEVIITFLIEIFQLPNFDHMTTSTILFELRDKICW